MARQRIVRVLILFACLSWTKAATADVVVDWNSIAAQAVAAGGAVRPGPSGLIDLAMVQLAVHDALQAFQGRYEFYSGPIVDASGSPVAAVAKAARDVLYGVGLTVITASPLVTVDDLYSAYLSSHSLLPTDPGILVGQQAAVNILNLRVNNTGAGPPNPEQFFGGTNPGEWRPTSFTASGQPVPMTAAYLGTLIPFMLHEAGQFRGNPPPHLKSGKYVDDYNEVKALGRLTGSARTPEQTDTALFFADNAIQYWNRALRALPDALFADSGDRARLFALVNAAMADALITSWESKLHWNFWRPLTAIQLGDTDGNPRTDGDPTWQPFLATPNYPDYTSGANNLSGAATTMLANFFGTDKMSFTMTSNFVHPSGLRPQNPRVYERFSDAAGDVVDARIFEGIHFRSADEVARRQGKQVANSVFSHYLRPVN
jgi:hypothetical protein